MTEVCKLVTTVIINKVVNDRFLSIKKSIENNSESTKEKTSNKISKYYRTAAASFMKKQEIGKIISKKYKTK